jgi:hypothetical protein
MPAPVGSILSQLSEYLKFQARSRTRSSHVGPGRLSAACCSRDCVVYSATCDKLNGASVVLKVYDKAKISAIKHRSVRREARIMRYLTEKG